MKKTFTAAAAAGQIALCSHPVLRLFSNSSIDILTLTLKLLEPPAAAVEQQLAVRATRALSQ